MKNAFQINKKRAPGYTTVKYSKKWIFKNGHDDARARAKNAEGKILTPLLGRGRRPPSSEGAGARARARARALSTRSEIFTDQAGILQRVSTLNYLSNATLEKSVAAHGADNE